MTTTRLDYFKNKIGANRRYWWFERNNYLPQVYANLNDTQFDLLVDWYEETERANMIGECNIPVLETILGFVYGHNLKQFVQLGHYAGYSTLFFGWAMQYINGKLTTIDINKRASDFTLDFVIRAGLTPWVNIVTADSTDKDNVNFDTFKIFPPDAIFIDSSHTFDGTVKELELWFPLLKPGGIIFLHDVSTFAQQFDQTGRGGVHDAVIDWLETCICDGIMLNRIEYKPLVLQDGCGLGIIQKMEGMTNDS